MPVSGRGNGVSGGCGDWVLAVNKCPDTAQLLTMVSPAHIHHLIWFSWLTESLGVRYNRSPHLWPEPTNYFTYTLFTPDIHSRVWDRECWMHAAAKSNLNKNNIYSTPVFAVLSFHASFKSKSSFWLSQDSQDSEAAVILFRWLAVSPSLLISDLMCDHSLPSRRLPAAWPNCEAQHSSTL